MCFNKRWLILQKFEFLETVADLHEHHREMSAGEEDFST